MIAVEKKNREWINLIYGLNSFMNSEQAKQISLPDLLEQLGHIPVKTTKAGRELWYRSPFRDEKEPSFHTSF